ncbi:MAG: glycosyltransferase family 4 protein [Chloroflexi bacterium]|nr:glycosyltransferase family 4 protein [Chloroflexota bacterium]
MKDDHSANILNIIVDGIIYSNQKAGGISRLFNEIMPRICDHDENIHFQLLLNNKNIQSLPRHEHIFYQPTYKVESFLRPWRLWRRYLACVKGEINIQLFGDSRKKIWHSTYYTLPSKRWRGVMVMTAYDMIYERFKESYFLNLWDEEFRDKKRNAISRADKIISISHATKDDLINFFGVDDEKIQVIHLACSPVFQKTASKEPSVKPFILYIGGRAKYKNFIGLLQIFSRWSKNNEVDLVAVGADWSEEEAKNIIELKLSEKVRLIPYPNDIVLRDLYNQALAFVYPSFYEGFGIPLLEAMSCGCPVIASQIPSTVEVAGDVPIYHEPGNLEQLLSNLDQSYDESKSSKRILSGLNRAKSFSWERTAQQTAELYRTLIC